MKLQEIYEGMRETLSKKFNITKFESGSIGLDEEGGIWYGWSHRAIVGFKIGDKIFEPNFGDDKTKFKQHGSQPIKTLAAARKSALNFADYVS